MTVASTLTRLADSAVAARTGADLYRFNLADRIRPEQLKKNSDGTVTITGLDCLKVGLFNGVVSIVEGDLEAMVQQFAALRDAGIFLPPFRLDHSWSVLTVVGYFEELETYRRVDSTDNLEKLFLRGDVRITGSLDYTPEQIVEAVKRGALRNRSSELGSYITNAGVEIPLAYYGCAFVDIPAVEGLGPVQLSHATRSTPRSFTNLNADPEETHGMDPLKLARLKALRALVAGGSTLSDTGSGELADLENEATEAGVTDADVEASTDEVAEDLSVLEPDEEPAGTEGEGDTPPAADPNEPEVTAGEGDDAEVEQLRARVTAAEAEATRLRQAEIDRSIETLRTAGAIVPEIEEDAVALLRHSDEDVRRRAGAVLGNLGGRVNLTRRPGRTTTEAENTDPGSGPVEFALDLTGEAAGELWASLTSEQRATSRESWEKFLRHRQENGIRD